MMWFIPSDTWQMMGPKVHLCGICSELSLHLSLYVVGALWGIGIRTKFKKIIIIHFIFLEIHSIFMIVYVCFLFQRMVSEPNYGPCGTIWNFYLRISVLFSPTGWLMRTFTFRFCSYWFICLDIDHLKCTSHEVYSTIIIIMLYIVIRISVHIAISRKTEHWCV